MARGRKPTEPGSGLRPDADRTPEMTALALRRTRSHLARLDQVNYDLAAFAANCYWQGIHDVVEAQQHAETRYLDQGAGI